MWSSEIRSQTNYILFISTNTMEIATKHDGVVTYIPGDTSHEVLWPFDCFLWRSHDKLKPLSPNCIWPPNLGG